MIDKNHTYKEIRFLWNSKTSVDECTLRDRTYDEALLIAKKFGYSEPRWYKPWTWGNWMIVTK